MGGAPYISHSLIKKMLPQVCLQASLIEVFSFQMSLTCVTFTKKKKKKSNQGTAITSMLGLCCAMCLPPRRRSLSPYKPRVSKGLCLFCFRRWAAWALGEQLGETHLKGIYAFRAPPRLSLPSGPVRQPVRPEVLALCKL